MRLVSLARVPCARNRIQKDAREDFQPVWYTSHRCGRCYARDRSHMRVPARVLFSVQGLRRETIDEWGSVLWLDGRRFAQFVVRITTDMRGKHEWVIVGQSVASLCSAIPKPRAMEPLLSMAVLLL